MIEYLKLITDFLSRWGVVVLIIFLILRSYIILLLKVFINSISNIKEVRWKELVVILKDPNVPTAVKVELTKALLQDSVNIQEVLKKYFELIKSMRFLKSAVKNTYCTGADFNKITNEAINKLEDLLNALELITCDEFLNEKINILKKALKYFRTPAENALSRAYPVIDGLSDIDEEWGSKDPEDYKILVELKNHLKKMMDETKK